jgi:hypothetical protein
MSRLSLASSHPLIAVGVPGSVLAEFVRMAGNELALDAEEAGCVPAPCQVLE